MTKIENMREDSGLGRLLSECFAGGERLRRELRLSAEQAEEAGRRLSRRRAAHGRELV